MRSGLHFYRDRDGREFDFVLERRDGAVAAIEVNASVTVRSDSLKHLRSLRDRFGDRFHAGYVLHLGEERVPFGPNAAAVPVSAPWGGAPLP